MLRAFLSLMSRFEGVEEDRLEEAFRLREPAPRLRGGSARVSAVDGGGGGGGASELAGTDGASRLRVSILHGVMLSGNSEERV